MTDNAMTDADALAVLDALHPVCPKPVRDHFAALTYDRAAVEASKAESGGQGDFVKLCHDGQPCQNIYSPQSIAAVTEAMVEAGAVGVFRSEQSEGQKWECWHESVRDSYRKTARAALDAALSQGGKP